MEAWRLDSRKIWGRFLVHVGICRREMIYIVDRVAEMEVANGSVVRAGELAALWGSSS